MQRLDQSCDRFEDEASGDAIVSLAVFRRAPSFQIAYLHSAGSKLLKMVLSILLFMSFSFI